MPLGRFSARGFDLAAAGRWVTLDPGKRSSESDFDSGGCFLRLLRAASLCHPVKLKRFMGADHGVEAGTGSLRRVSPLLKHQRMSAVVNRPGLETAEKALPEKQASFRRRYTADNVLQDTVTNLQRPNAKGVRLDF